MTNISFDPSGKPSQNLVSRIIGALVGVVVLGVALMFSAVVFVGLAIAALAFWGYFWWKTRALRRQMQEQMRNQEYQGGESQPREPARDGNVIDGEAVRLDDERDRRQ